MRCIRRPASTNYGLYICVVILLSTYADVCWRTVCWRMLTYAEVCWLIYRGSIYVSSFFYIRMLTYADVCWRMLLYADVCWLIYRGSIYVPSYSSTCVLLNICVLVLLYIFSTYTSLCILVFIFLYKFPNICVSWSFYICVLYIRLSVHLLLHACCLIYMCLGPAVDVLYTYVWRMLTYALAYVSIRQHTSDVLYIYVSLYTCRHLSIYMRHFLHLSWFFFISVRMSLSAPDACSRMRTYAHVCSCVLTYAHVCFCICVPMSLSEPRSTAAERALGHDA